MWASWCLVACFVSQAAFADTSDKGANNDESALAWAWWYVSEASEAILAQKQSIKPKPVRVDWRASRLGELDGVADKVDENLS